MIRTFRRLSALCTLTALLLTAASAAPAQTGAVFGSVDLSKLLAGYTKGPTPDQQFQALAQKYNDVVKTQSNSIMLSKADQTALGVLLLKSPRTSAEDAQVAALQNQASATAQELTTLQQKANPTDADKTRLAALTAQQQAGGQALEDISADYKAHISDEQDRLGAQFSDTLRAAIAVVAKQKGLAVVFSSQVAVYSANDITADVVKQLNK